MLDTSLKTIKETDLYVKIDEPFKTAEALRNRWLIKTASLKNRTYFGGNLELKSSLSP